MLDRQASIQERVRAVILFASATVLFVTAAAFVTYEAISFRANLVRNLSTLAAVIADNSAAPLAFDNKAIGAEILAALRAEPNIEAADRFIVKGQRAGAVVGNDRGQGGKIAHQVGPEADRFVSHDARGGHEQNGRAGEQNHRSHPLLYGRLAIEHDATHR